MSQLGAGPHKSSILRNCHISKKKRLELVIVLLLALCTS